MKSIKQLQSEIDEIVTMNAPRRLTWSTDKGAIRKINSNLDRLRTMQRYLEKFSTEDALIRERERLQKEVENSYLLADHKEISLIDGSESEDKEAVKKSKEVRTEAKRIIKNINYLLT